MKLNLVLNGTERVPPLDSISSVDECGEQISGCLSVAQHILLVLRYFILRASRKFAAGKTVFCFQLKNVRGLRFVTDAGECSCKVTRSLRLRIGLYEVIEASKEFCCTSCSVQFSLFCWWLPFLKKLYSSCGIVSLEHSRNLRQGRLPSTYYSIGLKNVWGLRFVWRKSKLVNVHVRRQRIFACRGCPFWSNWSVAELYCASFASPFS